MKGAAKVYVLADSGFQIEESDEQNNEFIGTVTLRKPFEKDIGSEVEVALSFNIGKPSYKVNDKSLLMDTVPVIRERRTFMPVRYVAEAVGSKVLWDDKKAKVTVIKGLKTIELWIGGNIARINGKTVYIDPDNPNVIPFIQNGRTYLPLRFVSEVLNGKVEWDPKTSGIQIDFSKAAIDDDVTWRTTDSHGNIAIDDDVTWMKDGRALWYVKLVDPDPPH